MTAWVRYGKIARLGGWAGLDQFLSALSNLVITLALARAGGATELGRFGVAFAAYLVVLSLYRALVAEPLLSLGRSASDDPRAERSSFTVTLGWAAIGTVTVSAAGLLTHRPEIVIVGLALPLLLTQDLLRYQAFLRRTPRNAALLDLGWVAGSALSWFVIAGDGTATTAAICWSASAALGVVLALPVIRPRWTALRPAITWWSRRCRPLARALFVDSVLLVACNQCMIFVLAFLAGDAAVGLLRAAQILFAPLSLALVAAGVLAIPYLADRPHLRTPRAAYRFAGLAVAGTTLFCGLLFLLQPVLNSVLFAGRLDVPFALTLPLGLWVVFTAAFTALTVVAKAGQRGRDIVQSRIPAVVLALVVLVVAAPAFGAVGAAWALAVQTFIFTGVLAVLLRRRPEPAPRTEAPRTPAPDPAADPAADPARTT